MKICAVCQESDPSVIVQCRDRVVRCADHANKAGYCWWCGDGEPMTWGDDLYDGMCPDCYCAESRRDRDVRPQR